MYNINMVVMLGIELRQDMRLMLDMGLVVDMELMVNIGVEGWIWFDVRYGSMVGYGLMLDAGLIWLDMLLIWLSIW